MEQSDHIIRRVLTEELHSQLHVDEETGAMVTDVDQIIDATVKRCGVSRQRALDVLWEVGGIETDLSNTAFGV